MLRWAKLERTEPVKHESVNLSNLLDDLVEYFEIVCRNQNIQLMSKIEPQINLTGDQSQLQELVTNLLSNAIKYIGEPKIINLRLTKNQSQIQLEVADTGIGIPKEKINELFKPFNRIDNHTQKGSGLGLAICKRIVLLHNGTISVTSQLNQGSVFIVRFPTAHP
jgi:signal transduction histidine kinase